MSWTRDPVVLGAAAAVLAAAIVLEGLALVLRPQHPQGEVTTQGVGPNGVGWGTQVRMSLCAVDLGMDEEQLSEQRASILGALEPPAAVADPATRAKLRGLDAMLLERWDQGRVLYDTALQPIENVAMQMELDSTRAVEAASLLMDPATARQHVRDLYLAWDQAWLAREQAMPSGSLPAGWEPITLFLLGP